jgi:gliding motility-associated protein GldM
MAHGKETPRQKMIGMMYLVLTALLALNVSKTILDAFIMVDNSLTITTDNFNQENIKIYKDFDQAYASNPNRVKPWKDKADEIRKQANSLYDYINSLKVRIVRGADGKKAKAIINNRIDPEKVEAKDNTDKPAEIMVGDHNNGEGKVLKQKIEDFRKVILSYIDKKDVGMIKAIKENLNTDPPESKEGSNESWESYHFEHWPLLAVTTIMSKMQSDVRNAESEIIRYLYSKIEMGSFKFNKLEPTIIPNSNYIIKGNDYQAEIFLAAFDTTQTPTILVDNKPIEVKNGRGIYTAASGGAPGTRKWGGIIKLKTTDGGTIEKPFTAEYQVAEATAVISPTKMNVFYLGVDNPVSISVPGVPGDKVFPTITNGSIRKVGNSYIVNPRQIGNALVTVTAEIDGKKRPMGTMEFRVKPIPDPIPKVAGRKFGNIDRNTLLAQMVVLADLEGFDFDAKFTVTEFTVSASINGFSQDITVKSNKISDAQKNIIRNVQRGQKVYFTDIKAVGPDGRPRDLSTIVFKIQ